MPCNSDYLRPSEREREHQRAAKLLAYVCEFTGTETPEWLAKEARDLYAKDERTIPALCTLVTAMTDEVRERCVYNAHHPVSRDLADWWERHLAADADRLTKESK